MIPGGDRRDGRRLTPLRLDLESTRSSKVCAVADAQALTVSQAAAACGITVHTLRYYERAGLLTDVPRSGAGRRRYGERELTSVRFIARLRATGMPVLEIKRYADLVRAGAHTEGRRLDVLLEHRAALERALDVQREHLAAIETKIALYREHLAAGSVAKSHQGDT